MKFTKQIVKEDTKMERKILAVLFVTMLVASLMLVLPVYSTPDVATTAYLDFAPDPIGVGQTLLIIGWISPVPPSDYYYEYLELTVTDPTPSSVEMGPLTSDSEGAIWVTYTPSMVGNYTVELFCPEQILGEETYLSSCVVATFTVGPESVDPNYVPEGYDVPVFPDLEVALVFDHVINEGYVQVEKAPTGPPLDEGSLIGPYYYITTTAEFENNIIVKINYDDTGLSTEEQDLELIQTDIIKGDVNRDGIVDTKDIRTIGRAMASYPGHRRWNLRCDLNLDDKVNVSDLRIAIQNREVESTQWTSITKSVDTVNNIIIGETDHLDPLDPFGVR